MKTKKVHLFVPYSASTACGLDIYDSSANVKNDLKFALQPKLNRCGKCEKTMRRDITNTQVLIDMLKRGDSK